MVGLGFSFGTSGFVRATDAIAAAGWRPSFYAPDALVWLFAALLASVTSALAVLAPAWRLGRVGLASIAGARHGRTAGRARLQFGLLVAQVAVTMVLLVAAATLTRATAQVTSLNPGFTMKDVQVVAVLPGPTVRAQRARATAFYGGLMGALDTAGLGPVAFSDLAPFSEVNLVMMARRPDEAPSASRPIPLRPVSRNYFAVLNIAIVRGRAPASDTDSRELVVNEAAARVLWPNADPIGQAVLSAVTRTEFETFQVVGIVRDTPVRSMSEIDPVIYRSPSWMSTTPHLLLRSPSPTVVDRARAVAASLESDVTMTARPFSDFVLDSLGSAVLASRGAWAIGTLGLILAIVGAFGVFSHEVEERRHEIGIRRAVGAGSREVATLLMRTARQALLWGLGAGFALSLLAVPLLQYFLYGLSPFDPVAYGQVGGILTVATVVATWVPIRRAICVDPARTLRGD
jgi:putative ABC transport system permease protein